MKKIVLFLLLMFFAKLSTSANNLIILEENLKQETIKLQERQSLRAVNWAPYMRKLNNEIKSNWEKNENFPCAQVVVRFSVGKNGELIEEKITKTSNNEDVDKRALEAIEKTFPFDRLPEQFIGDSVPVEFTFGGCIKPFSPFNPQYKQVENNKTGQIH